MDNEHLPFLCLIYNADIFISTVYLYFCIEFQKNDRKP